MPALGDIYYTHSGHRVPGRPPLVLIHGEGGTHLDWPASLRRLPGEAVYALDLPGHGKSGGVGRQSAADYASAALEWLKASQLDKVVLVGHSLGGAIALSLALSAQDYVAGLVLAGTGARLKVGEELLHASRSEGTFPHAVTMLVENAFAPAAPARLTHAVRQRMLRTRPPVLHGDLLACGRFKLPGAIHSILVPTLVISGTADRALPDRYIRQLAEQIAGAVLVAVPGAGHFVMLEKAQAVTGAVHNYLRRYWGAAESGE